MLKKLSIQKKALQGMIMGLLFCSSILHAEAMTQSEAHLSVNNDLVQKYYNFNRNPFYKKIYDLTVAKEKQFNDTHYVFYNAFSNEWRVPQDLYLKLYEKLNPLSIHIENLRAFRWLPIDSFTPKEFIKNELLKNGMVIDMEPALKVHLLSTNLALFGNIGFWDECTFDYFLKAKSFAKLNENIFKGILDLVDSPTNYSSSEEPVLYKFIPEIYKLIDYLEAKPLPDGNIPQTLAQIFLPKEIVDDMAYLSWIVGIPYDLELAKWIFSHSGGEIKNNQFQGRLRTSPFIKELGELFKDQKDHPVFQRLLKGIEEGKYRISSTLDVYKTAPHSIPGLNNLQARIIATSKHFGNVSSGIKTYTYDGLSLQQREKYETELNKLTDKITREFLKINAERSGRKMLTVPEKPIASQQQPTLPGATRTPEERRKAWEKIIGNQ